MNATTLDLAPALVVAPALVELAKPNEGAARYTAKMHGPAGAGNVGFPQQLVLAVIRTLHLDVHAAVAGDEQVDVVQLQFASERVDVLVHVLVDVVAVAR